MLSNRSATALAVVGDVVYWLENSRWDSRYPDNDGHFYWNQTLFKTTCTTTVCDPHGIVNLGQAAAFPDEFTSFKMKHHAGMLYLYSRRGNSNYAVKIAAYDTATGVWHGIPASMMSAPFGIHATSAGLLFYDAINHSFSATGLNTEAAPAELQGFTPLGNFGSVLNVSNSVAPGNLKFTDDGAYIAYIGPKYFRYPSRRLFHVKLPHPSAVHTPPASSTPEFVMEFDENITAASSFVVDTKNNYVYYVVGWGGSDMADCNYTHPDKLVRTKLSPSGQQYEVLYENPRTFCFSNRLELDPDTGVIYTVITKQSSMMFGQTTSALCSLVSQGGRWGRVDIDFKGAWSNFSTVSFSSLQLQFDSSGKTKRIFGWAQTKEKNYPNAASGYLYMVDSGSGDVALARHDRPANTGREVADISVISPEGNSVFTVFLSYSSSSSQGPDDLAVYSAPWDLSAAATAEQGQPVTLKTTAVIRPFAIRDLSFDFEQNAVLFVGAKADGASPLSSSAIWAVQSGLDGQSKQAIDIPFPINLPAGLRSHVANAVEIVTTTPRQLYLNFGTRSIYQDLWKVGGVGSKSDCVTDCVLASVEPPALLIANLLPSSTNTLMQWEEAEQLMHWQANGRIATAAVQGAGSTATLTSLDYTWVPDPSYAGCFLTDGIYTILGFLNGSVTLNTKQPGSHSFHQLEMASNESAWTPKTLALHDGKLYLGEICTTSNPTVGRIRVAQMPPQQGGRQALRARAGKPLLAFGPFIGNTTTLPAQLAIAPSSCLPS
jgi:hypothetical protein